MSNKSKIIIGILLIGFFFYDEILGYFEKLDFSLNNKNFPYTIPKNIPESYQRFYETISQNNIRTYINQLSPKYSYINNLSTLVRAICYTESRGNELAIGASGEIGAFQIMPETFDFINQGYRLGLNRQNLINPFNNTLVAFTYLNYLNKEKNANTIEKLTIGYNTGSPVISSIQGQVYHKKIIEAMQYLIAD